MLEIKSDIVVASQDIASGSCILKISGAYLERNYGTLFGFNDKVSDQQNVITKKNLDEDQNFFLPVNESTEILKKLRKSAFIMPSVSYKMFKDFHKSIKAYEAATKEMMNDWFNWKF